MTAPTPPPPVTTARKRRWPWIVAAVVVLLGVGAAVGGKKGTNTATSDVAATTVVAATTTTPSEAAATSTGVRTLENRPRATAGEVDTIAAGLGKIQPDMASIKTSRVESWSDSMCGDIWLGAQGRYPLPQLAVMRFAGGQRPPLTEAQGQQIVDLIAETYCS